MIFLIVFGLIAQITIASTDMCYYDSKCVEKNVLACNGEGCRSEPCGICSMPNPILKPCILSMCGQAPYPRVCIVHNCTLPNGECQPGGVSFGCKKTK